MSRTEQDEQDEQDAQAEKEQQERQHQEDRIRSLTENFKTRIKAREMVAEAQSLWMEEVGVRLGKLIIFAAELGGSIGEVSPSEAARAFADYATELGEGLVEILTPDPIENAQVPQDVTLENNTVQAT